MPENEILAEIRRVRNELARECNYDVNELFAQLRRETAQLEAEGWKVVDLSKRRDAVRAAPPIAADAA